MPTRSKFALFGGFLNFRSDAPNFRSIGGGGGGMCILFEICGKKPFQKGMGWGGGYVVPFLSTKAAKRTPYIDMH